MRWLLLLLMLTACGADTPPPAAPVAKPCVLKADTLTGNRGETFVFTYWGKC